MKSLFAVKVSVAALIVGAVVGCTPPQPCLEDMACWDCTSMGNGICGGMN